MGVTITRSAMLSHCRALTAASSYTEGEVIVCVLDFKVRFSLPPKSKVHLIINFLSVFIFIAEGGWIMARCVDCRAQWHARHFHSVRVDENQSGIVDANDYQV